MSPIELDNESVLGLRYDAEGSSIIILNNLSGKRQTFSLELTEAEARSTTDLFGDAPYGPIEAGSSRLRMAGHGYRWLRLGGIY